MKSNQAHCMQEKPRSIFTLTPLKITLIYLLIAVLWIVLTDRLLESLISDPYWLSRVQTYKGLFYMVITSVGLYLLINTHNEQLNEASRELAQSLIEGEDRERKRIAGELHDGLGQYLVAAKMNLESVQEELEGVPLVKAERFETGLSLLKEAISETRNIAYDLMPRVIHDFELTTAIESLIENLRTGSDIDFSFHSSVGNLLLTDQARRDLYRILQELLSNVLRHSGCDHVSVRLTSPKEKLILEVEDDGIGIDIDAFTRHSGLGLRSIRTRVQNTGGKIHMESKPGHGLKTTIIIPDIRKLIRE